MLVHCGPVIGDAVGHQAPHLVFHGSVQDPPGELHYLGDLVAEHELVGQNAGESPVAERVVESGMFEHLVHTAPREPEHQHSQLVVLISHGTAVVDLSPSTGGQAERGTPSSSITASQSSKGDHKSSESSLSICQPDKAYEISPQFSRIHHNLDLSIFPNLQQNYV